MALPQPVRDANDWIAADFPKPRGWARALTPAMLAEIEDAARRMIATGTPFWQIRPEDVPLPLTEPFLAQVFDDLESGTGFSVLSSLPAERFDRDGNAVLFAVVGCHLGRVVDQTVSRKKIEDIVDRGLPMNHQHRGYMGTHALAFHTDGSDFAVLYCLGEAAEGGHSVIVSVTSVFNAILRERPDVMETLLRGFHHHRRGEQPAGEAPYTERIPVFAIHEGLVHCCYNRNPVSWMDSVGLSYAPHEIEALDYLDATIARPEMQLHMGLQTGDMQFINNYNILHGRTAYRDGPGKKRHLLRLWLANPRCRRAGDNIIDLYAPWESRPRRAA